MLELVRFELHNYFGEQRLEMHGCSSSGAMAEGLTKAGELTGQLEP